MFWMVAVRLPVQHAVRLYRKGSSYFYFFFLKCLAVFVWCVSVNVGQCVSQAYFLTYSRVSFFFF